MNTTPPRIPRLRRGATLIFSAATLLVSSSLLMAGWTPLANLPPAGVALMLLLSDGTVMAQQAPTTDAAGNTYYSNTWYRLTPDAHGSYVNGTWTERAPMLNTRLWYSSVVLRDGRVLVAGAEYPTGASSASSAEIYDPVTDRWNMAPAPGAVLSDSVAKILSDGKVMVGPAGGGITRIYDPATNTWSAGPTPVGMANQNEVTWLKLPDDSILTIPTNSFVSQRLLQSTSPNQWINDGTVPVNVYSSVGSESGGAFWLPNGKAWFIGGDSATALYTPTGNNTPGTWTAGANIPAVRNSNGSFVPGGAPDAGAAMMVNGRVLCAISPQMFVNPNPPPPNIFPTPTSFAIYDPIADSFATINGPTGATVNVPSYQNLMLALPDGTVLYSNFGSQLYTYSPDVAPAPLAAGKPTITSIATNPDGSYHLIGTQLNGISEGASYGDDAQMDTNYPLVRLTASNGDMTYARTFNWSSTSIQTGTAPVSTEFVLPAGIEAGGGVTYSLVVVANGISSDPITFASPIWVDFNYGGFIQNGTFDFPYKTLDQGVAAVASSGTIALKGPSSGRVTTPISKPMTIFSAGGPTRIGP